MSTDVPQEPRPSQYETRVRLATAAVLERSDLTEGDARALAEHVLAAVDRIPERIR
jgi:hypothetical protein